MLPELVEATEEHEERIKALFDSVGAPLREAAWERAFGSAVRSDLAAKPYVTMLDGNVTGFAVAHRRLLHLERELYEAQVITDFVAIAGEEGDGAARVMLEVLTREAPLSFAGGWSVNGVRLLRGFQWRFVAPFLSWSMEPLRRPKAAPGAQTSLTAGVLGEIQKKLSRSGAVFFQRPAHLEASFIQGERFPIMENDEVIGWLRIRHDAERGEAHLIDARFPIESADSVVAELAAIGAALQARLFITGLNPALAFALTKAGAASLKSRWGLFCFLSAPRYRELVVKLNSQTNWMLFPADFDLDV
ncbi:hypothetical protein BH09SUM1_BH09SUM1_12130 [soil metagenome]